GLVARRGPGKGALGLRNAARIDLGRADGEPRLGDLAAVEAVEADRRRQREISGAPAELVEATARAGGEQRQAGLDQKLVVAQRRGHDALEEIARRDGARTAHAFGHDLAI